MTRAARRLAAQAARPLSGIRRLAARLAGDCAGISIVEFAVLCPVLLILYLCGAQYSEAIVCGRKVTITARAVTDLVTQYPSVTASQVDTILSASSQIMAPYSTGSTLVRVSQVKVNGAGKGIVLWSRARNGTPLGNGVQMNMPSGLDANRSVYILGEVQYAWSPTYSITGLISPRYLSERFFLLPRVSSQIDCSGC